MNKIICGDVLSKLNEIPDCSVDCCVTSPPYWGLRDYGADGQIGLEETPDLYVEKMVQVFNSVKKVLKDSGSLWLNLGDSYYNYRGKNNRRSDKDLTKRNTLTKPHHNIDARPNEMKISGFKNKDLMGIPWKVAFALRDSGWYLRQDIIWHKPNPMPESVTDRCTSSHEYIFLLTKSPKYFYDYKAIREPWTSGRKDMARLGKPRSGAAYLSQNPIADNTNKQDTVEKATYKGFNERFKQNPPVEMMRNKRSVWYVATSKFKGSHFATFPPNLIRPCILAGCPKEGIVLDPFAGSGTTLYVARELGRKYIGIEINPEYIKLIEKRLEQGVFNG